MAESDLEELVREALREIRVLKEQVAEIHSLFKPTISTKLSKKEIHRQKVDQKKAEIMARLIGKT